MTWKTKKLKVVSKPKEKRIAAIIKAEIVLGVKNAEAPTKFSKIDLSSKHIKIPQNNYQSTTSLLPHNI